MLALLAPPACRLWRLFIAGLLGAATSAPAVSFVVDTTADAPDASPGNGVCATASGGCSLRAAVQETNALAGADTISLPAGLYLLTLGGLDVNDALTITGAGAAATIVDANHASRVFDVGLSSPFAVSGVTIRNGDTPDFGGGINAFFTAPVSLTDCVVTGNRANIGGGIVALRGVSLTNTTVSDNTAVTTGGGLGTIDGTIRGSTFARNTVTSSDLGGLDIVTNGAGTLTILNSTVEDEIRNVSICFPQPSGVQCTPGTDIVLGNVTVGSITFLSNTPGGSFTARNSVIRTCAGDVTLISQGHNLIGTAACSITGDTTGNVVGVDPLLGPLAANGGPTETHEPLPGSPVLDAGDPAAPGSGGTACEATDQRGVARPQGPRCDIGAVELAVCDPCHFRDGVSCVVPPCTLVPVARATLSLAVGKTDAQARLSYRWRGGPVSKADFDDPRVIAPHVCAYDGAGNVLLSALAPEDTCGGNACWRETLNGYRYRDPDLTPDGLAAMSLSAGIIGTVPGGREGSEPRAHGSALPDPRSGARLRRLHRQVLRRRLRQRGAHQHRDDVPRRRPLKACLTVPTSRDPVATRAPGPPARRAPSRPSRRTAAAPRGARARRQPHRP